ncbi:MAG: ParB N-terminal domain-containing protein [Deltaproteobacteria bacterium]|nr:ParB N-terminal domain-containing protein [Deltaproteobacteria bacterium]
MLASLAEVGQLLPVVVSAEAADRYVLLDGYKRVRALQRLSMDGVQATVWSLGEIEALLLDRLMRSADPDGALEQGWLSHPR